MLKLATLAILSSVSGNPSVTCQDEPIPTLEGWFKKARVCCPTSSAGQKFPVTVYQHGDGGGGEELFSLYKMFDKMAAEGVCVVAPYSCPSDG